MSKLDRSDILTLLFHGFELALNTSPTGLQRTIDSWTDYHSRHRSQLRALQTDGLIETRGRAGQDGWAIALTEAGRLRALGGRDAPERWARGFDGEWNMLMFDLDSRATQLRQKLRRWLHANDFGCLQQSVWITPDTVGPELETLLADYEDRADQILVIRSEIAAGKDRSTNPRTIASQAWDFDKINAAYKEYLDLLKNSQKSDPSPKGARHWIRAERQAWNYAFSKDPLLPEELLPKTYLGKKAWNVRGDLLKRMAPIANSALTHTAE